MFVTVFSSRLFLLLVYGEESGPSFSLLFRRPLFVELTLLRLGVWHGSRHFHLQEPVVRVSVDLLVPGEVIVEIGYDGEEVLEEEGGGVSGKGDDRGNGGEDDGRFGAGEVSGEVGGES